jgi:rhodanese-related sulfurtransferase
LTQQFAISRHIDVSDLATNPLEMTMSVASISPRQLSDLVRSGAAVELIDVRTPVEFREVHVGFARNLPLDQLEAGQVKALHNGSTQPLYVICRSGSRGRQACEQLIAAGVTNVVNVEGGTLAWDQAGLPVVRGKKAISLERQVRIVAGSLVFIGSLLALTNPWWLIVPGFIGAGLTFAGITDTCGMAMMLARMPWNQVPVPTPAAPANAASCQSNAAKCCS